MKRTIFFIILIFLTKFFSAFSQNKLREIPDLPFANFAENRIIFPADSAKFVAFFEKLHRLRTAPAEQLNVVYMGGSHVQAGILTGRLRENLISLVPISIAGRGLIFPFSAAKTNNPSSFKVRHNGVWQSAKSTQKSPAFPLGLTGIALETADHDAKISVSLNAAELPIGTAPHLFSRVKLLADADSAAPVLLIDTDTIFAQKLDADNAVFEFQLPKESDSLTILPRPTATNFRLNLRGILLENPRPGIVCHGVGVNGATLNAYLKCEKFTADLALLKPDLVILAIGVNDAMNEHFSPENFKSAYASLLARIRAAAPDCALLFVSNNDTFRRKNRAFVNNKNGALASQSFRELAQNFDTGFWDLYQIMGSSGAMKRWEEAGFAKRDKVHFTAKGYLLLGDLLFNALENSYQENLENFNK